MAYLNRVFLIGNLTRDPELRVTPKGTSIASFGLAINRQSKNADGSHADEVTFVDIEAWGKQAELVAKYLARGAPAMIEGRLKLDEWTDKTSGQKRSRLKVVLENVQFLGRKSDGTPAELREGEHRQDQGQPRATTHASNAIPGDCEDVPF
jgi:single-strand DNA-binding protein